ncbi:hypothetical protein [Halocola ammonii]
MKNVIISYSNLPNEVKEKVDKRYPHGFDHDSFEFEHPQKPVVYTAVEVEIGGKKFLIKLDKKEKKIDRFADEI